MFKIVELFYQAEDEQFQEEERMRYNNARQSGSIQGGACNYPMYEELQPTASSSVVQTGSLFTEAMNNV